MGRGGDINVLTTTSLILRCQHICSLEDATCHYVDTSLGWGGVGWGGDINVAESMASVTKHQLRRHGLSRNAKDPIEHRNTLAVHYLNKNPGLEAVLSALARFRTTVSQGLVAPSRAFLEAPWEK